MACLPWECPIWGRPRKDQDNRLVVYLHLATFALILLAGGKLFTNRYRMARQENGSCWQARLSINGKSAQEKRYWTDCHTSEIENRIVDGEGGNRASFKPKCASKPEDERKEPAAEIPL
ncbi:hypothetical protein [Cohaesibacter intestini]|uniref:hypothetical protein n=1 Tax=Cohaesibacter intestini TaxID=2211145 RepID=UPI0013003EA8|nr:hypothetical protein [Cohaesibacter intestini]